MAGWQDDPVVAPAPAGWQNDPIVSGGDAKSATTNAYKKTAFDKITDIAADSATLGLSKVINSGVGSLLEPLTGVHTPTVAEQNAILAQEGADVGPLASTAASIAGYAAPGKILGPIASSMTGGPLSAAVAEGAMAGGISGAANNPSDPVSGAGWGAAEGGTIGGIAHGVGQGLGKLYSKTIGPKPPQFDPAQVISDTKATRDTDYSGLKKYAFDPDALQRVHSTSATLDPGMMADVTPGMMSLLSRQRQAIANGGNTANDIADYIASLKSVSNAPGSTNGDTQLAGKIGSNLEDFLGKAKPITDQPAGEALDSLLTARLSHQRYVMAQNLAEWQRRAEAGAPIGERPLTEAENWYQNKPDQYRTLVDLYQGGKAGVDPSQAAAHLGSEIGGTAGYAVGGFPGHLIGKTTGYFGGKVLAKNWKGARKLGSQTAAIQAAYPTLTGVQAPSTPTPPNVGEALKTLAFGMAY